MGNSRARIGQDAGRRRETRLEFRTKVTRLCKRQNTPTTSRYRQWTIDTTADGSQTARPKFVRVSPYIIKPPFPSDGGCAAASAGRSGLRPSKGKRLEACLIHPGLLLVAPRPTGGGGATQASGSYLARTVGGHIETPDGPNPASRLHARITVDRTIDLDSERRPHSVEPWKMPTRECGGRRCRCR